MTQSFTNNDNGMNTHHLNYCDLTKKSNGRNTNPTTTTTNHHRCCDSTTNAMCLTLSSTRSILLLIVIVCLHQCDAFTNEFEKTEQFLDKINLEQSIAAVLQKVAYGSTTKRSIPDNAYPVTTLATPLLTTYRYSDGSDEYFRVDVKQPSNSDYEQEYDDKIYGVDLEKDHVLPTSAPAADILKNNNNRHYENPNRYSNDKAKPRFESDATTERGGVQAKTTQSFNLRNVRPTKSIYSKDVPSYVPPSRAFFTPPLPPEYLNPFADKPTLRGTNSDSYANRRPIPPPSLMPNKDRIPFRPDLPPNKVINIERMPSLDHISKNHTDDKEKKKSLNTPSQNINLNIDRVSEFYGLNQRNHNDSNFEYDKGFIPSITRILSGSNGRHDDSSGILIRLASTQSPPKLKVTQNQAAISSKTSSTTLIEDAAIPPVQQQNSNNNKPTERLETITLKKEELVVDLDTTTQSSEFNQKSPSKSAAKSNANGNNITKASNDEIWFIAWNVHVYLVVLCYIILAIYSIYKLVRYENDPHMFSKSYFLTIHLMLTVICVLRIFYLTYDPYNVDKSFNILLYDFLHNFPLSLLATTFAILILFLLKRTLTHLKVKTSPVFLVVFGLLHILLCFVLSILEACGLFDKASLVVCKPVFVLLSLALGLSYLYLYKMIKNVLAKKSQNLSEMCTQNISYASHITIAAALLFILLGIMELYALFFIKVDRFNAEIKHHWILWSFELSVRFIEISIITLLAIVVSLRMSQREKQTVSFPLFPCTTSETSSDNIYPNNCNTNPNALNYTRQQQQELIMDNLGAVQTQPAQPQQAHHHQQTNSEPLSNHHHDFERFERPKWGSDRFDSASRPTNHYNKPKYELDTEYHQYKSAVPQQQQQQESNNLYSEPVDNQYFERSDFDRRSRNSSNTSGRRSTTGRSRKNHPRAHLGGIQTLPNHDRHETMIVDDQGFVRFRHMQDFNTEQRSKRTKKSDLINHYSDA